MKTNKIYWRLIFVLAILAGSAAVAAGGFFIWQLKNGLVGQTSNPSADWQQRISDLENKVNELSDLVAAVNQNKPTEVVRREIIKEKSQEELLTAAVARVAPTVVSIAVTKDIPQLEIVYENPFGDDPFFKDFDFRIPRYRVKGTEPQKVGAGTGFLIDKNGYILTNRHVVEDTAAQYTVLLSNGAQKTASVVYRDTTNDIAVIKINGNDYAFAAFGDSASLKLGHTVFAIGNALGEYNNSVSVGIVSGLNRDITAGGSFGQESLKGVIQTDAAINPGNSGGPLVNLEGKVVGINVAKVMASENIGFAIPINEVKKIVSGVVK